MKISALLLIAVLLLSCFAACTTTDNAGGVHDDTAANENEKAPENYIDTTETYEFYQSEEEVYEIASERVQLYYPTKWQENVVTEITEDETSCRVSFSAVFGEAIVPLYDFIFIVGEAQEGYLLGTISTEAGEQKVYLVDRTAEYDGVLSEEDASTFFDMCEAVNDIISKLVYDNGMILA